MLIADVPVILLGKFAARKMPFKAVRIVTAGLFAVLAVLTLVASRERCKPKPKAERGAAGIIACSFNEPD